MLKDRKVRCPGWISGRTNGSGYQVRYGEGQGLGHEVLGRRVKDNQMRTQNGSGEEQAQ